MYSFPPLAAAIGVLYTVVAYLTTFVTPLFGGSSAAAVIVIMTMAIRLVLVPLGWAQVRAERQRARLAPQVRDLQHRYRRDQDRLRRELTALYAREGTSPLAGCWPAMAQAPIFTVLYGLFLTTEVDGHANVLLSHTMAGVPLGTRLFDAAGGTDLVVFAALLALLAAVAWGTRRLTTAPAGEAAGMALIRALPFGTVLIATVTPLAAGLYLLTTTSWTLGERTLLRRVAERRGR